MSLFPYSEVLMTGSEIKSKRLYSISVSPYGKKEEQWFSEHYEKGHLSVNVVTSKKGGTVGIL